jgi:hypothetical protein
MIASSKTWAIIELEYKSGKYSGIPELIKALRLTCKDFPSQSAIEKRSAAENWQRASLIPAFERNLQKELYEEFKNQGYEIKTHVKNVVEMTKATKPCIVTGYGKPKSEEEADGEPQGFATEIEDWQARDKGLTHYEKLTGILAPEKQEIDGKNLPVIPPTLNVIIAKDKK